MHLGLPPSLWFFMMNNSTHTKSDTFAVMKQGNVFKFLVNGEWSKYLSLTLFSLVDSPKKELVAQERP